ncbi:Uncharacterised protein [Bordetella pertussis]|nr:Uncharacterised protein [Bordetella pertussis]
MRSWCRAVGAGWLRAAACTLAHSLRRYSRSAAISSSVAPSACVRTMKPPFSSGGISACRRSRNWVRSDSESIFCEMPMWGSCGRYTSMRPAMLICVDSRAPLVPSGSLMTCTIRVCPSNSSFSIGVGVWPWLRSLRFSRRSAIWMKAARSRPISMKALCMPGSTRTTRPR